MKSHADRGSTQTTERRSERLPPVYFVDRNDGRAIRLGKGPKSRITEHLRNGYELLAVMPGGEPIEKALHRAFEAHRLDIGGASHYAADAVFPYIEALLKKGLATDRLEDVEHVPVVPWEAIAPDAVLNPSPDYDGDQRILFPETNRKARLANAAALYLHSSKSDEWYTPSELVDAARRTLGEIDLDPASCWKANRRVRATYYYSENVSGLASSNVWRGRVWMNPPYGDLGPQFAERLAREYRSGNVTAACALFSLPHLSSLWFSTLSDVCSAIGVTRGRVQFDVAHEEQIKTGAQPTSGHVVVYLGPNRDVFEEAFGAMCTIYWKPRQMAAIAAAE